jgi:hypothetical protein
MNCAPLPSRPAVPSGDRLRYAADEGRTLLSGDRLRYAADEGRT